MGLYTILLVIHSIIVLFLIMLVLVQRTDSDGMGGLGGGGGNQFMTGRGAANLMTRTTAILAAVFMITSLALAIMASRMSGGSIMDTPVAVEEKTIPAETKESSKPAAKESAPAEEHKAKKEAPKPAVPKPE